MPNVFWGWDLNYEADLIAVSKAGCATEIEIKISASDLRADKKKKKFQSGLDARIFRLFYAIPESLKEVALVEIPEEYGIIIVSNGYPRTVRQAKRRKARKVTDQELTKLTRLGTMKYWDLSLKIHDLKNRIRELEARTDKGD